MLTKKDAAQGAKKRRKLVYEMLGYFAVCTAVAVFFFGFLVLTANSIVFSYCDKQDMFLSETQQWAMESWIINISTVCAVILFAVLFIFVTGRKLGYLKEIIDGIDALRTHRMDYQIPLEGNNELTELAESINYLSRTERELQLKENLMREEREGLIRALSHDIRTPLTAIISYSEYMKTKKSSTEGELAEYFEMMEQKGAQIKSLTDRLLNGGRMLEKYEDGRFLMIQLAEEWLAAIEDDFSADIDMSGCADFSAEIDIQEMRRIFDNLASNVVKYADCEKPVRLEISSDGGYLSITQSNNVRIIPKAVESNGIGLESIRKIAEQYGGEVSADTTGNIFTATIRLMKLT